MPARLKRSPSEPPGWLSALMDASVGQSNITVNGALKQDRLRRRALLVKARFQIFIRNIVRPEFRPVHRHGFRAVTWTDQYLGLANSFDMEMNSGGNLPP